MTESKTSKSYNVVAPGDLNSGEFKKFYKSAIDTGIEVKGSFHISDTKLIKEYFNEKKYPFSILDESKAVSDNACKPVEIIYTRILGKLKRCTDPEEYPIISVTKKEFLNRGKNINQYISIWKRTITEVISLTKLSPLDLTKTFIKSIQCCPNVDPIINSFISGKRVAFGRRKPESKEGHWDGACVLAAEESKIMVGLFANNMDHVSDNDISLLQAISAYLDCVEAGWVKMTNEDVTKTCGMQIDEDTITEELFLS